MALNDRQKRFCEEYIIDSNASQAAIRAGYSSRTANRVGPRLLKNPEVKKYLNQLMQEVRSENIADASEVLNYLTSVLRGESSSEIVVVEGVGEGCSSARRVSKAPDEKERLKAAELLGKRYGIFTDRVGVEGAVPVIFTGEEDLKD